MNKLKSLLPLLAIVLILFSCSNNCPDGCANGGECINGDCLCAEQWTGINCTEQKTPSRLIVKEIKVLDFPQFNSGAAWDVNGTGPDIFISINKGDQYNENVLYTSKNFENANNDQPYTFTVDKLVEINEPKGRYGVAIWDKESGLFANSPTIMTGTSFIPYSNNNNFSEVIDVDFQDFHFQMTIEYRF